MWRTFLVCSAMILALTGTGLADDAEAPAGDRTSDSTEDPTTGSSDDAASLNLDAYREQVVYLDFWASWCGPCRKSFPWMASMHEKYAGDGLVIIAVNLDRSRKAAEKFLAEYTPGFRVVFDPDGKLAKQYEIEGMPTSIVFDRGGKLLTRHIGFREKDAGEMEKDIEMALARAPAKEAETASP